MKSNGIIFVKVRKSNKRWGMFRKQLSDKRVVKSLERKFGKEKK